MSIDKGRIEKAVREILEAIGEDPDRDGLRRTPERVANMYAETLSGLHDSPDQHLAVTFESGYDEMVMVRDIPLYSTCEHHLIPFIGSRNRVYEVLSRKRPLTLAMVRRLHAGLGIPAESLIKERKAAAA